MKYWLRKLLIALAVLVPVLLLAPLTAAAITDADRYNAFVQALGTSLQAYGLFLTHSVEALGLTFNQIFQLYKEFVKG